MALRRTVLVALVLVLAGCGGGRQGVRSGAEPRTAEATVEVINQSWVEMVVYAVRETQQRVRLGTVGAQSRRVLEIPDSMVGGTVGIRFVADPVGGSRNPYTNELNVQPGQRVRMTIPNRRY